MYSGLVSSAEVKLALELILCVLTLLYICPHTVYMCPHTILYMVKLAPELSPLLLQRSRTRAIPFFGISFFGHKPPPTHTHRQTGRQTDRHTEPQPQPQPQTDTNTNTLVNLKLEQYLSAVACRSSSA